MKIVQYIAETNWGGGPQHVFWLARELIREGLEVEVWSPSKIFAEKAEKEGLSFRFIPNPRRKALAALRKQLRKENPLLFHLHGVRAGILGGFASKNLPHSICYTEHHLTSDVPIAPWRKNIQCRLLRAVLNEASAVIAPSRATADFILSQKLASEAKLHLVPHGLPKITSPMPMKLAVGKPVVGTIGSLLPVKNFDILIKAIYLVPGVNLVILGSGPEKNKLLSLVKALDLSGRIQFIDKLDDPYPFLVALDIYLQPSSSESFGLSVLQAMQLGIAPIVSSRGALPELVESNKTGIVLTDFTAQAWANAIISLISDSKLRKNLASSAEKRARKDYSIEKMAQETNRIYNDFMHWR